MARSSKSEYYDEDYSQVGLPNKPELSALVKQAIGDGTMSNFAELCETSLSTLSRIVNPDYEIRNPISPALIRKIADNAANKQEVTLDKLMEANGMESREKISMRRFEERNKQERELFDSIKETVLEYLRKKKYGIWEMQQTSTPSSIVPSRFGLEISSDFLLMIQGVEPKFFNFIIDRTSYYTGQREELMSNNNRVKRYTSLFLMDCWESEILRDYWNTIVFTRPAVYELFVKQLSDVETSSSISAILIDTENKSIKKHFDLKREDTASDWSLYSS